MTSHTSYRPCRVQFRAGIGGELVGRAETLGPPAADAPVFEEAPYVQVDGDILLLSSEPPSKVPGTGSGHAEADRLVELITGAPANTNGAGDAGDELDEVHRERLGPFLGLGDQLEPGDTLEWSQDEHGAMTLKVWSEGRLVYGFGALSACREDLDGEVESIAFTPADDGADDAGEAPRAVTCRYVTRPDERIAETEQREIRLEEEKLFEIGPYRVVLWHTPSERERLRDLTISIVHEALPITPEQLYRSRF